MAFRLAQVSGSPRRHEEDVPARISINLSRYCAVFETLSVRQH